MSTIDRLSIQGIRSFSPIKEQVIQFQRPLTVICGPNGTGKSTIIECLKYATTGELPPGCGISGASFVFDPKLIDQSQVQAAIKMMCRNAQRKRTVVARLLKSTKSGGKITCKAEDGVIRTTVNRDGAESAPAQSFKKQDMDKAVPELLGVSPAILNNVILCHQEESNWPLTEGADLKKRFDDIFESSRYTEALKEIRKTKKELDGKAKEAEFVLRSESEKLSRSQTLKASKATLEQELAEARRDMEKIDATLQISTVELKEITAHLSKNDKTVKRIAELEPVITERQRSIELEETELIQTGQLLSGETLESLNSTRQQASAEMNKIEAAIKDKEAGIKDEDAKRVALAAAKESHLHAKARADMQRERMDRRKREVGNKVSTLKSKYSKFVSAASQTPEQVLNEMAQAIKVMRKEFDDTKSKKDQEFNAAKELTEIENRKRVECEAKINHLKDEQAKKKQLVDRLTAESREGWSSTSELDGKRAKVNELAALYEVLRKEGEEEALKDELKRSELESDLVKKESEFSAAQEQLKKMQHDAATGASVKSKLADVAAKSEQVRYSLTSMQASFEQVFTKDLDKLAAALEALEPALAGVKRARTAVPKCVMAFDAVCDLHEAVTAELRERQTILHRSEVAKKKAENELVNTKGQLKVVEADNASLVAQADELNFKVPKVEFTDVLHAHVSHDKLKLESEVQRVEALLQEEVEKAKEGKVTAGDQSILTTFLFSLDSTNICPTCEQSCANAAHVAKKDFHSIIKMHGKAQKFDFETGKEYTGTDAVKAKLVHKIDKLRDSWTPEKEQILAAAVSKLEKFRSHVPTYMRLIQCEERQGVVHKNLDELYKDRDQNMARRFEASEAESAARERVDELSSLVKELDGIKSLLGMAKDTEKVALEEAETLKLDLASLDTVSSDLDEVKRKADSAEKAVRYLRAQKEELNKKSDARRKDRDALSARLDKAKQELAVATDKAKDRADLDQKLYAAQEENKQLLQQIAMESQAKKPVDDELARKRAKCDSLERDRSSLLDKLQEVLADTEKDLTEFETPLREWREIEKELASEAALKVDADLAENARLLANSDKRVREAQEEIKKLRHCLNGMQAELLPRLERNVKLVKLRHALVEAQQERQRLESDSGNAQHAFGKLRERALQLQKEEADYRNQQSRLRGIVEVLTRQLSEKAAQLAPLERVDRDHHKALIDHWTLIMAARDLAKFHKALDQALMMYHALKVTEINKRIKELWQTIYRGKDIDLVELRAEPKETATTDAAGTKQYSYRVVMRKIVQDGKTTDLDMRGRCSAGQKVLASIVIRLALAESFSLNCGVLALDEPTTNLDEQNKEGLAQALADIIKAKANQDHFQLIIITHDEEFVDMLRQSSDGLAEARSFFKLKRVLDEDLGVYVTEIKEETTDVV